MSDVSGVTSVVVMDRQTDRQRCQSANEHTAMLSKRRRTLRERRYKKQSVDFERKTRQFYDETACVKFTTSTSNAQREETAKQCAGHAHDNSHSRDGRCPIQATPSTISFLPWS